MVKIMANIRNFQANVRKAQSMAKTSIPNEIETDVKADISKFHRALQRAKAMALKWREHTVKIDGNNAPLRHSINGARAMLATLFDKTVKVKFDTRGMTRAQILTRALNQSLTDYGDKMDALASKIRTFGTVFSQQVKGLMIASVQALIPIIAGLVPAIMAVLNAVGVLGGGVLGLAGAFSIAGVGAVAFGAMAISAIKMLKDGTLQATKETRAYQSALEGVKTTWQGIIKQNQAQIFNTLANSLNTVKTALTALKPFISGVAQSMEQASQKLLKWSQNSQVAQRFFNMMNTTGVKTFNALLSAAGRFGDGLVNVFTQLAPLFLWVANGLDSLGQKFQNWANSVGGQNAIRSFIEYTKTNLPKIGQIFGNVFLGIGNLMKAFAQNSASIFDWLVNLTAQFKSWSEQVGKSEGFKQFVQYVQQNGPVIMELIGNIVRALVAFGTAMAPIASVLLRFVTALAGFVANLFEAHPAIAKIIGVFMILGGAVWALMAPLLAVGTVLSNVFGVSLISAIGSIGEFISSSGALTGILNVLRGAFAFLMNPVANIAKLLPMLGTALTALTGPVGIVIAVIAGLVAMFIYLWKTNENFRNTLINAWNGIVSAVSGAVSSLVSWFQQLGASIMQTLQPIMPILQKLGQFFSEVLGVVVVGVIQLLITSFQALWNAVSIIFTAIGAIISSVIQIIVGIFTAFIQLLTGDFSGAWLTLQNTIINVGQTIWGAISSIWNQISNFIFTTLNKILGTNITSWGQIWSAITGFVTRIWNSVSSWFSKTAATVLAKMVQAYSYIVSNGARWVSSIWNTMISFVSRIISGFVRVVSEIESGMQRGLDRITSFFGSFMSAGAELIGKVAEGIAGAAWRVASAVGNAISNAWSNVTSFVASHGGGMGGAVSQAQSLASRVGDAFSTELSSNLTDGLGGGMGGVVDTHMTKDVQHSMQENNRPIVNITVRNESDIPAIKSYIEETNAKNASFQLM